MSAEKRGAPLRVGDWLVEPQLDAISRAGETHKLEPRTMRLFVCLIDAAGQVVSIEQLLDEVWSGVIVSSASVYQAVSQLRKLLGDTDPNPTYIATVPRKGYRLLAAVSVSPPAAATAVPARPDLLAPPAPRRLARRSRFWLVGAIGAGLLFVPLALWKWRTVPALSAASIAVLPFVDLTDDKGSQAFCDGLTEELSNWLAQIPALRVVARTSAFAFQGHSEDVRKIGRQLDTERILEGSMRRSGDHMRVTVQLIDARSGYHLWSANYDRAVADTIALQDEISRSVAENLQIRMTAEITPRFAARRSDKPQAYESYLLARHEQQARNPDSNQRAIGLYRQALAVDPQFALAQVGLAYALLNENVLEDRPIEAIATEAEPLLNAAVRHDPGLSDIYSVRGALRAAQSQEDAALADFDHAIRLNPNDSVAFAEMGRLQLLSRGQPRDALFNYTRAAALDPLNYLPQAQRCLSLQDLGQFKDAADSCARARALQPDAYWPLAVSGAAAAAEGRLDEALDWNLKALRQAPKVFWLHQERADILLTLGLPAQARRVLESGRASGEEAVDEAMSLVAYAEGGVDSLRRHLETTRLEATSDASRLFSAAYFRLLAGDVSVAAPLVRRALKLSESSGNNLQSPWDASRSGHADGLTAAMVEMRTGERALALRHLDALSAVLEQLLRNGEKRFGVEELMASVQSLRGDADGAMRHLTRAADLGWRRSWWAEREPDLSSLWGRADFAALMARVDAANAETRGRFRNSD